jgi:hypothetical protein
LLICLLCFVSDWMVLIPFTTAIPSLTGAERRLSTLTLTACSSRGRDALLGGSQDGNIVLTMRSYYRRRQRSHGKNQHTGLFTSNVTSTSYVYRTVRVDSPTDRVPPGNIQEASADRKRGFCHNIDGKIGRSLP